MKLDLNPLLKNETEELDFQFKFQQPDIDYYGDTITFEAPVEVKGTAKKISDQMYLETEIAAHMSTHCARCLQEVQREILVRNFDELLPAGKESQTDREENVLFYEGHQIDLMVYAQEQVMVNLPIKTLCRDNCAGICTTCGNNLNEEPCQCKPEKNGEEELDPRLAQLRDWLQKANE
jgi:uncharacterized protein